MLKTLLNPTPFSSRLRRLDRIHPQIRMNHNHNTAAVLPRLPVPDLQKTITKYLDSLRPFLLEDAARGGDSYENAFALRTKWAEEFVNGIGRVCQERLHELDRNSPDNWLDDNFWLKSYLQSRVPLLINSNWWLVFNDDPLHPSETHRTSGFTEWQIQRAAWLVHRTLELKDKVEMQELHPVTTRTGVWIQESVSRMFNLARIPKLACDVLSQISPPSDPLSRNVVVIVNDWFYTLSVYDIARHEYEHEHDHEYESTTFKLIDTEVLQSRLNAIVNDATTRTGCAPQIGVLSADDRDSWALNLQHLLSISPQNIKTHEAIVKSLMCLCLDNETHTPPPPPPSSPSSPSSPPSSSSPLPQPSTISQNTLDAHLHAIRSVPSNVSNRFFDKPFSIIVDPSGRAGATGEHSPCDALVPSIVAEYAVVQCVEEVNGSSSSSLSLSSSSSSSSTNAIEIEIEEGWSRLDWVVDEDVLEATRAARERAETNIKNSDDSLLWFEEYGSDWIKSVGFSSDAYIQMAMQIAWYRTTGNFTATYETALTRMFNKGRTETIRTLSVESRAFVLAMTENVGVDSDEAKYHLLRRAIRKHTSLTRDAATGRGIDRHLLGLRSMLRPGEQSELLIDDVLFGKSQEWRLSTSGLSAGHHFRGTGFGAGYENGYGINYLAAPSMVKFGIETKFSGGGTSAEEFKSAIYCALMEMREIILHVPNTRNGLTHVTHEEVTISRL
ncbi:acyltransferase ChoActase/COT/CPT [Lentinula aff. detonsa]|uniref:Acyltransferase ChoActase/COT/CPT n=1 Tax=Lentinula aff. detonsa TaxID=2804958 RepID=A0AA38KPQ1_9AGAR|nr:acyltransferase ChoActase/COT/CPT [Lentinula aff. detonsa]